MAPVRARRRRAAPPAPDPARRAADRARRCARTRWSARSSTTTRQVDDARHTMILARTAAAYGAHVRQPRPGRSASCARASGSPAPGCATSRPAASSRSGPSRSSTPPGSGPTRPRRMVGERGQFHVRASKGSTSSCRATGSSRDTGLILRTEKSRAVRHPVGPALDHRHHRHRLGRSTRPTRRASAADIDYLLDHVNAVLRDAADPRRRRGRVRRAAAAAGRRVRGDLASSPASTPSRTPSPGLVVVAGGKYTTYRVMAKDAVDAAVHGARRRRCPSRCTEDIPLVGAEGYARAVEPRGTLLAERVRAARRPGSSTCCDRYGIARSTELLDLVAARPDAGRAAARRRGLPAGRDRLRRLARGRAAPRRRPGPAHPHLHRDLRPRRRRAAGGAPSWWRRCSAGTTTQVDARGRALPGPGRGRARVPGAARRRDRRRRPAGRRRRADGRRVLTLTADLATAGRVSQPTPGGGGSTGAAPGRVAFPRHETPDRTGAPMTRTPSARRRPARSAPRCWHRPRHRRSRARGPDRPGQLRPGGRGRPRAWPTTTRRTCSRALRDGAGHRGRRRRHHAHRDTPLRDGRAQPGHRQVPGRGRRRGRRLHRVDMTSAERAHRDRGPVHVHLPGLVEHVRVMTSGAAVTADRVHDVRRARVRNAARRPAWLPDRGRRRRQRDRGAPPR